MLALTHLDARATIDALAAALRSTSDFGAVSRAVVGEHIRAQVAVQPLVEGAETGNGLSTARIKSQLRRNLSGIWAGRGPDEAEHCFETSLRDLASVGDIFDAGSGHWITAPLRLVDQGSLKVMVAGGLPNFAAGAVLKRTVTASGLGRFIDLSEGKSRINIAFQSPDGWFGRTELLDQWTSRMLNHYERELATSDDADINQLEVYCPDIHQQRKAFGRWMAAQEAGPAALGLRLFRPVASVSRTYDRPYFLGKFSLSSNNVVLRGATRVPYEISLRLRFGLDQRLQVPRVVELRQFVDRFDVNIPFKLPMPEAKVIALSWGRPSGNGDSWHTFGVEGQPIFRRALDRLGIHSKLLRGDRNDKDRQRR